MSDGAPMPGAHDGTGYFRRTASIVRNHELDPFIGDVYQGIDGSPSYINLISGPSAVAPFCASQAQLDIHLHILREDPEDQLPVGARGYSEFSGLGFVDDWLFCHDVQYPGETYAITGPWRSTGPDHPARRHVRRRDNDRRRTRPMGPASEQIQQGSTGIRRRRRRTCARTSTSGWVERPPCDRHATAVPSHAQFAAMASAADHLEEQANGRSALCGRGSGRGAPPNEAARPAPGLGAASALSSRGGC